MSYVNDVMHLPDEIIDIIRAYSKPCTSPHWKKMHKFTLSMYQNDLRYSISQIILYKPRTYQNYVHCGLLTETLYKNTKKDLYTPT